MAVATVIAASVMLAACGGGGADAAPSPSPTKAATTAVATPGAAKTAAGSSAAASPQASASGARRAQAMLLTLNDFPGGWSRAAHDTSGTSPLDRCADIPARKAGQTDFAQSDDFSKPATAGALEQVAIYETPQALSAALATYQGQVDCVVGALRSGQVDNDRAAVTSASATKLSAPAVGDASQAWRVQFHSKSKDRSGAGSEGDTFIDFLIFQKGRVGVAIVATGLGKPFPGDVLQFVALKAAAKIPN